MASSDLEEDLARALDAVSTREEVVRAGLEWSHDEVLTRLYHMCDEGPVEEKMPRQKQDVSVDEQVGTHFEIEERVLDAETKIFQLSHHIASLESRIAKEEGVPLEQPSLPLVPPSPPQSPRLLRKPKRRAKKKEQPEQRPAFRGGASTYEPTPQKRSTRPSTARTRSPPPAAQSPKYGSHAVLRAKAAGAPQGMVREGWLCKVRREQAQQVLPPPAAPTETERERVEKAAAAVSAAMTGRTVGGFSTLKPHQVKRSPFITAINRSKTQKAATSPGTKRAEGKPSGVTGFLVLDQTPPPTTLDEMRRGGGMQQSPRGGRASSMPTSPREGRTRSDTPPPVSSPDSRFSPGRSSATTGHVPSSLLQRSVPRKVDPALFSRALPSPRHMRSYEA
eukprot:TRINITY_DN21261_c0_g1_i1.p1 TRINITY_DN21261_c0_g1~~TRINITY_DN21261_c0_g1_i1.p1  ORF type:complete len:415 (+),score=146.28 TRINITY_DN21261_c0_g1_i1:71-1246(+)